MRLINDDCYKAIKEIEDNSVDLIIIDPPYEFATSRGGGAFGSDNCSYRAEYIDLCKAEGKRIDKNRQRQKSSIAHISKGFDYSLFQEFERVMKKVNCYIWCSKMQVPKILTWAERGGTTSKFSLGIKLTRYPQSTTLI